MVFLLGLFMGKGYSSQSNIGTQPVSFRNKQKLIDNNPKEINIDNSKYVTNINTDTLEKKYETLGDITTSKEQINTSISKLKNLKG
jgi:hypothetical protein